MLDPKLFLWCVNYHFRTSFLRHFGTLFRNCLSSWENWKVSNILDDFWHYWQIIDKSVYLLAYYRLFKHQNLINHPAIHARLLQFWVNPRVPLPSVPPNCMLSCYPKQCISRNKCFTILGTTYFWIQITWIFFSKPRNNTISSPVYGSRRHQHLKNSPLG